MADGVFQASEATIVEKGWLQSGVTQRRGAKLIPILGQPSHLFQAKVFVGSWTIEGNIANRRRDLRHADHVLFKIAEHLIGLARHSMTLDTTRLAEEEQRASLLVQGERIFMAAGELIGAIGMTEPSAGSDLQGLKTRAVRDGDQYVINGSKIFITNGYLAGLIALVVKTQPGAGAKGTSILMVETANLQGFRVGRILDKMGLKSQDTAELFFDNVRVPAANLLGDAEGQGFYQLMGDLPYERAVIAVAAVAAMEGALAETIKYVKDRKAFGKSIAEFQNTKFKLAEIATKTRIARVFVDDCIAKVVGGTLDTATASMAKYWTTDTQQEVLDECVQLHGGYGYMNEYLVCRMFADSRVQRIYGGTNEIMKELISRAL